MLSLVSIDCDNMRRDCSDDMTRLEEVVLVEDVLQQEEVVHDQLETQVQAVV